MKKQIKKPVLVLLALLAGEGALYFLGGFLEERTELGGSLKTFAVFIGVIPVLGLYLFGTKDGKRIKKDLIDPFIKPTGNELEHWDEDGKPRQSPSPAKNEKQSGKEELPLFVRFLVPFFLILALLAAMFADRRGISGMQDASKAMDVLFDGIAHMDSQKAAKGAGLLLSAMKGDLFAELSVLAALVLAFAAALLVIRIYRKRNRYRWEDNDMEEP